MHFRLDSGAGR